MKVPWGCPSPERAAVRFLSGGRVTWALLRKQVQRQVQGKYRGPETGRSLACSGNGKGPYAGEQGILGVGWHGVRSGGEQEPDKARLFSYGDACGLANAVERIGGVLSRGGM